MALAVNHERLECDGYTCLRDVLCHEELTALEEKLDAAPLEAFRQRKEGARYAIRNVHLALPGLKPLLQRGRLSQIAEDALGETVQLVGATLFDKLPGANWFVPPHQDLFVPVAGSTEDAQWTNWSTKAGVQYVEPPLKVQRRLLAVRVHLDECPERNGALEVVPGSHVRRLSESDVDAIDESAFELCPAGPGDLLLMHPLLVHRSRAAELPRRRRVLHIVYSGAKLPDGLRWT